MWTLAGSKEDLAMTHGYFDGAYPETSPMMKGARFYVKDLRSYIGYTKGFMGGMWHRHLRIEKGLEQPYGIERLMYLPVRRRAWWC